MGLIMSNWLRGCTVLMSLLAAGTAQAECSVSSDAEATVRPLNATAESDANLIVSMSMLPKLMHIDYAGVAKKPACNLGQLTPGDTAYELWGDDAGGRQRKGLPAKKGRPVALLVPVTDIMKAIEASKVGKAATVEGYLLATVTKTDFTGWRFYTAMPDVVTLKHDMAEALAGRATPIFSNGADGKTSLFVSKS